MKKDNKIWLSSHHIGGGEQKYLQQAFESDISITDLFYYKLRLYKSD